MGRSLRDGTATAADYAQAVFTVLGFISVVAWLVDVATSKHHHPLTYWLVISLALLLVASLIWGARRDSPRSDGAHIHVERAVIINQVYTGHVPPGAPEAPGGQEDR